MSKEKELTHEDVKKIVSSYMNEEHVDLVEKAYHFAEVAHHDHCLLYTSDAADEY